MNLFEIERGWVFPLSILAAGVTLLLDYLSGPFIHFPVLFLIPILFASWNGGKTFGLFLAISMPLVRLVFEIFWDKPWGPSEMAVNLVVQSFVLAIVAFLTDKVACQHRELKREVNALEGLLPICSFCKKIRNDKEEWEPIEIYIRSRSDTEFSHGLCPECAHTHYADYFPDKAG